MKIKGNSGCDIILKNNIIYKYPGLLYTKERLYSQFQKQRDFYEYDSTDYIKTPCPFWNNDHIEMDYIDGYNFVEFCDISTDEEYANITKKIVQWVWNNQTKAKVWIPLEIFEKKFYSIYDSFTMDHFHRIWDHLKDICKDTLIPSGQCHGDLSCSNILIGKDKKTIWFIDFLETFYDCPMQDLVKLKQSTQYHWDLLLYDQFYNKDKVIKRLEKFDYELNINTNYYPYQLFQFFNLLRIIPYTKDQNIKEKLEQWIINLAS